MNIKDTFFLKKTTINCNGILMDLSSPKVMGILNYTPDSFYDGGRYSDDNALDARIETLIEQGADIIDVGCYSSRPGATDITAGEEKARLIRVLGAIRKISDSAVLSVDTFRPEVAFFAVKEYGVAIINDITAGYPGDVMLRTAGELKVPYIMMHMKGNPRTMVNEAVYDDLLKEVISFFSERVKAARAYGIRDIIIDPGFGFAKGVRHNFEILHDLDAFRILDLPVMVGVSRKSFIWRTLGVTPDDALNGTTVMHTLALMNGADILRAHDVKEAKEAVRLFMAYKNK